MTSRREVIAGPLLTPFWPLLRTKRGVQQLPLTGFPSLSLPRQAGSPGLVPVLELLLY